MNKILLAGLLSVSVLVLSGCGQTIAQYGAQKAAEKAVENSLGGNASVDFNKDGMEIETENGSIRTGENVALPKDMPSDVYIIDGKVIAAITGMPGQKYSVSIVTDMALKDVGKLYETKMKEAGWKITSSVVTEDMVALGGKKDNRILSVIVGKYENNQNMVTIGEILN